MNYKSFQISIDDDCNYNTWIPSCIECCRCLNRRSWFIPARKRCSSIAWVVFFHWICFRCCQPLSTLFFLFDWLLRRYPCYSFQMHFVLNIFFIKTCIILLLLSLALLRELKCENGWKVFLVFCYAFFILITFLFCVLVGFVWIGFVFYVNKKQIFVFSVLFCFCYGFCAVRYFAMCVWVMYSCS